MARWILLHCQWVLLVLQVRKALPVLPARLVARLVLPAQQVLTVMTVLPVPQAITAQTDFQV